MFAIKSGTPCLVIKSGAEWRAPNIREWKTTKDNLFDKEEMIIDPTGIATWANTPGNVTIGSWYAERGYYGFEQSGYVILCHASRVAYIG